MHFPLLNKKQNRRVRPLDIAIFFRQLASLMLAGIPIIQCCEVLEKSQEKIGLRLLIYTIKREILTGKTLFQSVSSPTHYFDELTCQMIRMGEHTGKLDTMLLQIANMHEKKLAYRKRIQQALFYPCLVASMSMFITLGLFLFVVPRFAELFKDNREQLPFLTLAIFYLSAKLQQYAFLLGITLCLFILCLIYSPLGRELKSLLKPILLKLPLIHTHYHHFILMHFSRNLAMTVAAGIPLIDALDISAKTVARDNFVLTVALVRYKMNSGLSLHQALNEFSFFPHFMTQMIKIGEESGMLETMLNHVADYFETETEQRLTRLGTLLEPLIMIVQGVLIGGLVIAMYLPLFKLGTVL